MWDDLLHPLPLQGVVEYALALFFNKLVSYTFLFWLPFYVHQSRKLTFTEHDVVTRHFLQIHNSAVKGQTGYQLCLMLEE